ITSACIVQRNHINGRGTGSSRSTDNSARGITCWCPSRSDLLIWRTRSPLRESPDLSKQVLSLYIRGIKTQYILTLRPGCLTIVALEISLRGCQTLLVHH